MEYRDLTSEYSSLLREKAVAQKKVAGLRYGYISFKTISGKTYPYLQYKEGGKLISKYIKNSQLHEVMADLGMRTKYLEKIQEADKRLEKIEAAAGILDKKLLRKLTILRRCAAMDAISVEEKVAALGFSIAMTALEGIPASEGTEKNLSRWVEGELRFLDSYLETLRKYKLVEM